MLGDDLMKSKRHEFFVKRLKEMGLMDEDSDYNGMLGKSVRQLSMMFARQGHSGTSAQVTVQVFNKLMDEWNDPKTHQQP